MDFKINLSGNLRQQATADADALRKLNDAIVAEKKVLGAMETQMKAIQRAGVVDIAVFKALSGAIQQQKDKVAGLTQQQVAAGAAGLQHANAMKAQAVSSGTLASFLGNTLSNAFTKLIGLVRDAASAIIGFAEAKGDATRMLETVYRSEQAAENTYSAIIDVTKRVAISQEKAVDVADALTRAGEVNGNRMIQSIEAIGKAEAARKGAGDSVQGIIERANKSKWFSVSRDELRAAGLTFKDLATTISKQTGAGIQQAELALRSGRVSMKAGLEALTTTVDKVLGGIAEKKFMTIGVQSQKLRDTFGRLFDSLDTSKIAAVLGKVVSFFDEGSVTGAALTEIFVAIFDALGDAVEMVWPYVQTFLEFLILTALKVWNAFRPVRKAFQEMFGGEGGGEVKSFEDALLAFSSSFGKVAEFVANNFVPLMMGALVLLTPTIWGLVTAVGSLAVGVLAATWPALALIAALVAVYKVGEWLGEKLFELFQLDWGAIADDIITGLVRGIVNGIDAVVDAFGKLGKAGLDKFRSVFGIKSPSTVMALQGKYLDQGLQKGIEDNAAGPANALGGSAGSPSAIVQNSTTNNSSRGSSVVFSEGSIVLNFSGGGDAAEQVRAQMPSIMADIFEQLGLTMGAEGSAA